MSTGELKCWGDGLASHPTGEEEVEILLVTLCYRILAKLRPGGQLAHMQTTYVKYKI